MTLLIMPKATAVWMVNNTSLTFKQIADFTGLHHLEVKAIADGDVAPNIVGKNPILQGAVKQEEIDKAEDDRTYRMKKADDADVPQPKRRGKGPKYTPKNKRADKPDGIAYMVKNYPDFTDRMIMKLIGTTKKTINKIRNREHSNMSSIKPRDPVSLGLCTRAELDAMREKAQKKKAKKEAKQQKKEQSA